ncbi:MAG: triphosphoribosyl-dephospho-CoA synthase CitG [Fusobacteriaceae bacterium]
MKDNNLEGFKIEDFLLDRELRVEKQLNLLNKYNIPLLVVRANYPGKAKSEYPSKKIVDIITSEVKNILDEKIMFYEKHISLEGSISSFVCDLPLLELKRIAVEIEEKHDLGRFVDIDVYDRDGNSISRTILNYKKRKCYICTEDAVICTREMKHEEKELKSYIYKSYEKYLLKEIKRIDISEKIGDMALKACIYEVSCNPSFGLVSPMTKGAHKDMDYFNFLESSFAIKKWFSKMAYIGYSYLSLDKIFKQIRKLGIEAEKDMFKVTKGVNTHKGMIFLLGITLASTAKTLYEKKEFENIEIVIKNMCKDILNDFDNLTCKIKNKIKLTNGEKLYLEHGFLGVRGVAKSGLNIVFKNSLPILEKELKKEKELNRAMTKTLLCLMSLVEDSTIVSRKGIDYLFKVQKEAKELLDSDCSLVKCLKLEEKYSKDGVSPGGSADLLGITLFLYFIKQSKISNKER